MDVKDKRYEIAEKMGVTKTDLHRILDVDGRTLRLWSYNPLNVSKETSELIFKRLAYLDLIDFKVVQDGSKWEIQTRFFGKVTATGKPWITGAALLCYVEERLSRRVFNYSEVRVRAKMNGLTGYSRIAADKSLELPVGVTRWDPSKNKERDDET